MAKHPISQPPSGYEIIRINGKHHPVTLSIAPNGVLSATGFIDNTTQKAVSYAKRLYAAHFLAEYQAGRVAWAGVASNPATVERIG